MPEFQIIEDPDPVVVEDLPEFEVVSVNPDPPLRQLASERLAGIKAEQAAIESAPRKTLMTRLAEDTVGQIVPPLVEAIKGAETAPVDHSMKASVGRAKGLGMAVLGGLNVPFGAASAGAGALSQGIGRMQGMPADVAESEGDIGEGIANVAMAAQPLASMALRGAGRQLVNDGGELVSKNPRPDPALSKELHDIQRAKGVDMADPQAVGEHVAAREGIPTPEVVVDPAAQISKTETGKVTLEPGTPDELASRVEHEMQHAKEPVLGTPPPVEDNNILTAEGIAKERATFAQPVEPGQGLPGPHMPDSVNPALDAIRRARTTLMGGIEDMGRQGDMVLQDTNVIQDTGTLRKEARKPFREAEAKPDVENLRISPADVETYRAQMIEKADALVQANRALREAAMNPELQDPLSRMSTRMARQDFEDAVARFNATRFAAGHTVGKFNKPMRGSVADMVSDPAVGRLLRDSGVHLEAGQMARQALMTEGFTNIFVRGEPLKGILQWTRLARMNLFSLTSFSIDAVGSVARHGAEAGGMLGRDAVWLMRGHPNFPNLSSYIRAIREKATLPRDVASELGQTVLGEPVPGIPFKKVAGQVREGFKEGGVKGALENIDMGSGLVTHRENLGSAIVDTAVGTPVYLKKAVDTASGRSGARVKMSAMAQEAANTKGLKGEARQAFVDEFLSNPPPEALSEIERVGKELQWNMPISKVEDWYNGQIWVHLATDIFPSWASQSVRGIGDMLGLRPATWARIKNATPAERPLAAMEWAFKAATGWGALYALNSLYDRMDFDTMELKAHPDDKPGSPGRYRFSSMDPLPEAFGLLAAWHRDWSKAEASVKHSAVPFVSGWMKESGLLRPAMNFIARSYATGKWNTNQLHKAINDYVNQTFPGQAVLGAIKSAIDPVARQGIGANLPGVSSTLPAKIETTTGTERVDTQSLFGHKFRGITSAPIRGAERETDAVFETLDYFVPESLIRSGIRTPFADTPVNDMPPEWQDEYRSLLGKKRWELLTSKKNGAIASLFNAGRLQPPKGSPEYEKIRNRVKHWEATANAFALNTMRRKYGFKKPKRQLSMQEASGAGYEYNPGEPKQEPDEPEIEIVEDEPEPDPTPGAVQ